MYLKHLLPSVVAGSRDLKHTKISLYLSLYCGTLYRKSPPTLWHFHQQLQGYTLSVLKPTGKRMLSFLDSPIDLNWSQFPFVWMGSRSKQSLWPEGWSRLTRVGLVNMSIPGAGATVMPIKSYGPRVGESGVLKGKSEEGESFRKKIYKIQE